MQRMQWSAAGVVLAGLMGGLLAGCGGSVGSGGNGDTPAGGSNAQADTYIGTTTPTGFLDGVVNMTLDHGTSFFSLTNEDSYGMGSNATYAGDYSAEGNWIALMPENATGGPFYTLEVQGGAAIVDMGSDLGPVVMAQSSNCLGLTGAEDFQFITLGDPAPQDLTVQGYGHVTITPKSGGTAVQAGWSFSNYDLTGMDGSDEKPAALADGLCAPSAEGYATTVPATVNGTQVLFTVDVGQTGFFVMDRDFTSQLPALVGVEKPAQALGAAAVAGVSYEGIEFDAMASSPQAVPPRQMTAPVRFANGVGSAMTGGVFANDDPAQAAASDLTLDLGAEDASNNGLFPAVRLTTPDPQQMCAGRPYGGTDAAGNPTCVLQGVAVAGNPGGKYALFVTVANVADSAGTSMIQFLLYQK